MGKKSTNQKKNKKKKITKRFDFIYSSSVNQSNELKIDL